MQGVTFDVIPEASSTILSEAGFVLARNLPGNVGWLASEPQGSSCLCYVLYGVTSLHRHDLCFITWAWIELGSLPSKHFAGHCKAF